MSLNSHWFQNDQPSKLEEKNVRFSTMTAVFFDGPTLMAGYFGNSGSSETLCTSFERSNQYVNGKTKFKDITRHLLWATPF